MIPEKSVQTTHEFISIPALGLILSAPDSVQPVVQHPEFTHSVKVLNVPAGSTTQRQSDSQPSGIKSAINSQVPSAVRASFTVVYFALTNSGLFKV